MEICRICWKTYPIQTHSKKSCAQRVQDERNKSWDREYELDQLRKQFKVKKSEPPKAIEKPIPKIHTPVSKSAIATKQPIPLIKKRKFPSPPRTKKVSLKPAAPKPRTPIFRIGPVSSNWSQDNPNQGIAKTLATRIKSEIYLIDEVPNHISRNGTNDNTNNDPSKSNEVNNSSQTEFTCNESVSLSSAIEQDNENHSTNGKMNQPREIYYTNDRFTQENSINMDNSSKTKKATRANERLKENSSYFTPRRKSKCKVCWKPHQIWKCQGLIGVCAQERTLLIQALRLCYKCLSNHARGECQFKNCAHCDGPHHALLCYKVESHKTSSRSAKKLVTAEPFHYDRKRVHMTMSRNNQKQTIKGAKVAIK